MIASLVTARRLAFLAATLSLGILAYRVVPEVDREGPEDRTILSEYRMVPVSGLPMWNAVDDSHNCVPFLKTWLERPDWEIQVSRGASSCTTDGLRDSFTIDARGEVTWWRARSLVRHLHLTPEELAQLTAIDRLDCKRTDEIGYGEQWYRVSTGGDRHGTSGPYFPGSSTGAKALATIFDAAVARYYKARLAELGTISADFKAVSNLQDWSPRRARYKLELRDHHIAVSYDKKLLEENDVEDEPLVDMLDAILAPPAADDELTRTLDSDAEIHRIRGTVTVGTRTMPLSLSTWDIYGPLEPVARAFDSAIFHRENPRD
jgi:hypothetical protein